MSYRYVKDVRSLPMLFLAILVLSAFSAQAQLLAPNLIYTTIQPCRIIDTRLAGGLMAAGTTRTFNAVGVAAAGSLASQGGNPSGCPIPGFDTDAKAQVQAVAVNLVAVGAIAPGDLVAWPSDQAQPAASVINYVTATAGDPLNIANMVILPVRQDTQGNDITVKAQSGGTHLVADVVGYFCAGTPGQGAATQNLFIGRGAGNQLATTGGSNTAFGTAALAADTTGFANTAFGQIALSADTTAGGNTAVGAAALAAASTGGGNTAVGTLALTTDSTAIQSTAVGFEALEFSNGNNNTAFGDRALYQLTTGTGNIGLGLLAGSNYTSSESNNIAIGTSGVAADNAAIRIGTVGTQTSAFVAGIDGVTSSGGTAVFVNASGQLGTATSSLRFKEDVEDMGGASADLMQLRPVTFHYKSAYDDGSRLLQYGLIAEEVAKVYPELVQYDKDGQPLTVRYHFVNAMLLNEVQKQHARIEEQVTRLGEQATEIAGLRANLEAGRQQAERQAAEIERQRLRLEVLEARLARLETGGTRQR